MALSGHELIFKQWEASLSTRDLSWHYIQPNFEELFDSLKAHGLESGEAYEYVARAIKAHSPQASLIKFKYKKTKPMNPNIGTEKEFGDNWIAGITSKANIAFFNVFPQQIVKIERAPALNQKIKQELSEFDAEDESLTLD